MYVYVVLHIDPLNTSKFIAGKIGKGTGDRWKAGQTHNAGKVELIAKYHFSSDQAALNFENELHGITDQYKPADGGRETRVMTLGTWLIIADMVKKGKIKKSLPFFARLRSIPLVLYLQKSKIKTAAIIVLFVSLVVLISKL